ARSSGANCWGGVMRLPGGKELLPADRQRKLARRGRLIYWSKWCAIAGLAVAVQTTWVQEKPGQITAYRTLVVKQDDKPVEPIGLATVIFLMSGTSWTVPDDWGNSD